jgi:hypothetical protein
MDRANRPPPLIPPRKGEGVDCTFGSSPKFSTHSVSYRRRPVPIPRCFPSRKVLVTSLVIVAPHPLPGPPRKGEGDFGVFGTVLPTHRVHPPLDGEGQGGVWFSPDLPTLSPPQNPMASCPHSRHTRGPDAGSGGETVGQGRLSSRVEARHACLQ